MTEYFIQAFVYLAAAVIAVPLAKRLGLGSVLGYLIAGVIIGPVIGLVGQETVTIQHFAEFGVVMMLFLVGMELEPKLLWEMRNKLIGLGGLQVSLSAISVLAIAFVLGEQFSIALAIGLIFALSSTAIVLQTLQEKGLAKTVGGRSAFAVLLFQDIAVIPMLAFIPLLAIPELVAMASSASDGHHESLSLVANLPGWAHGLVVFLAIAFVIVGGYFLGRPLFRYVVQSGLREVFTATALMLVIGIAALMSLVGLSPALGAFLAGVVLANSEFRHEIESNIEPFKGLLLGLFFITVGAGVDFQLFSEKAVLIIVLTVAVMLIKAAILYGLARLFKLSGSDRWLFTLSLAQAGEFGFVLLSYSVQNHVIPHETAQLLSMIVAISMFLTPGLFILFEKVIVKRFEIKADARPDDTIEERAPVIIAGIGRFGQIVNRLLRANGFNTVIIDHELSQIERVRRVGIESYFGDVSKPDLLHTSGIAEANLFVLAIDQKEAAVDLCKYLKNTYPNLKVLARAFDRGHYYELCEAGADWVISETYYSALTMGGEALKYLGMHPFQVEQMKNAFEEREKAHAGPLYRAWQEVEEGARFSHEYAELFLKMEESLSDAMKHDRSDTHSRSSHGWTPPPKGYAEKFKE